jgi:hypothetical protein
VEVPLFGFPDLLQSDGLMQIDTGAFRCIRTGTFMYAEHKNGEMEYYDLVADPYQMNNMAGEMDPQIRALHSWLRQLSTCTADNCRELETAYLRASESPGSRSIRAENPPEVQPLDKGKSPITRAFQGEYNSVPKGV